MRTRIVALATTLLLSPAALAPGLATADAAPRTDRAGVPDRIELPRGWQPEGITTDGKKLYVGSLATGAILRANPRTGTTVGPASQRDRQARRGRRGRPAPQRHLGGGRRGR